MEPNRHPAEVRKSIVTGIYASGKAKKNTKNFQLSYADPIHSHTRKMKKKTNRMGTNIENLHPDVWCGMACPFVFSIN